MKLPYVNPRKLYVMALVYSLSCLLSFCITVLSMAGEDDCGFANGAGMWVALNDPELLGPTHFHIRVPCHGEDPGFAYCGGYPSPGDYFVVDIEDAVIMHSDEMISGPWFTLLGDTVTGPAVWAYGRVTSTNVELFTYPGSDWVLLGVYDSGPYGQNKDDYDFLVAYPGIDEGTAEFLFDQIRSGIQSVWFTVFVDKGNAVVKMK